MNKVHTQIRTFENARRLSDGGRVNQSQQLDELMVCGLDRGGSRWNSPPQILPVASHPTSADVLPKMRTLRLPLAVLMTAITLWVMNGRAEPSTWPQWRGPNQRWSGQRCRLAGKTGYEPSAAHLAGGTRPELLRPDCGRRPCLHHRDEGQEVRESDCLRSRVGQGTLACAVGRRPERAVLREIKRRSGFARLPRWMATDSTWRA